MKWFKHDASANTDAKLKRLRMKYGMEGYGLYWYCLELIAQNVEKHNLTFELEHDSEIISYDTGIHYELVQEMITFMVNLKLFENTEGVISCLKMATRTDEYIAKLLRNKTFNVRTLSGQNPDTDQTLSGTTPDKVPLNRREQKRREQKRPKFKPPTLDEVTEYAKSRNRSDIAKKFFDYFEAGDWIDSKGQKVKSWKQKFITWENFQSFPSRENSENPFQSAGMI